LPNPKIPNIKELTITIQKLEEKIIFAILQRAQYLQNLEIYLPEKSGFLNKKKESFLEIRLKMQEEVDARCGRFLIPTEQPFCQNLPKAERNLAINFPNFPVKNFQKINFTSEILKNYLKFLPKLYLAGTDNHFGSSVEFDVASLRAISERIHFAAFFIAESKFQYQPEEYKKLILEKDEKKIEKKLTRNHIEKEIFTRILEKTNFYQQFSPLRIKVDPKILAEFFKKVVIAISKKAEVQYFLHRKF